MKRWMTWAITSCILTSARPLTVTAQEMTEEMTDTETMTSMEKSTTEEMETTQDMPTVTTSIHFKDYTPYGKFVNYQYQGDGTLFEMQDIIMEYPPDAEGLFQVTSFAGDQAIAHVYQIAEDGIYELAFFENYNTVEDMRHSEDAGNASKSLIIPKDPKVGMTYKSGFNQEYKRTVVDILGQFNLGGVIFNNVLKIHEEDPINQRSLHYYYAPNYGLILIELNDNTVSRNIVQLISTQGDVIEN